MTIIKPSYPRLQRSQSNDLLLALPFYEGSGLQVNDLSGRNNHGTLVNGPTWNAGKHGWAVTLDGTNDYINVPSIVASSAAHDALTISIWAKSAVVDSAFHRLIWTTSAATDWIVYHDSNNNWTFWANGTRIINGPAIVAGQWTHLAAVRRASGGAGAQKLYINGRLVGESVSSAAVASTGIQISSSASFFYNGQVDDARIYSRELSATEIAAIFNDPWRAYRPAKKISVLVKVSLKHSVEITPQPAIILTSVVAPSVLLGSVAITPQPATALTNVAAPIALLGSILVTPQTAVAITSGEVTTRISGASAVGKTISPTFRRLAYQPAMRKLAIAPTFNKL